MSRLLLIFKRNKTMFETKIWSVEEMVHEDEFTDRVELLRELDRWVKAIGRMGSTSTALIAPRRIGKTVLLDLLVNSVFFKPEYQVTPFYFKMTREKRILRKFLLEYATTFFRQYLAYCEQYPVLFGNKNMKLEELLTYQTTPLIRQPSLRKSIFRHLSNAIIIVVMKMP